MSVGRILVWFSCGAASAVAAKMAIDAYGKEREVVVMNVDMRNDEHPDNQRFLVDVENWIGQPIIYAIGFGETHTPIPHRRQVT